VFCFVLLHTWAVFRFLKPFQLFCMGNEWTEFLIFFLDMAGNLCGNVSSSSLQLYLKKDFLKRFRIPCSDSCKADFGEKRSLFSVTIMEYKIRSCKSQVISFLL
jgi:hypothetical protein